jgi:signal transduction histidine kinase
VGEIPENVLGLLNVVQRNTRRLESLTNDLLDQQQLECGKMDVVFDTFPVSDMLENIVEEFSPIMEKKNQMLTVVHNVETGLISADKNRLSQVLCNLLSNASKFSSENSDIFLIVDEDQSHLKFSVKDEGFGLSPENIEKLFKPFPEIDRPTVTEKSTGLGLSICKGIVNLHGGEIWAESEGRDMGSKFVFTIPKVRKEVAEVEQVLEEEVKAIIE